MKYHLTFSENKNREQVSVHRIFFSYLPYVTFHRLFKFG